MRHLKKYTRDQTQTSELFGMLEDPSLCTSGVLYVLYCIVTRFVLHCSLFIK